MSVSQLPELVRKLQGAAVCLQEGKDFNSSSSFGAQGVSKIYA